MAMPSFYVASSRDGLEAAVDLSRVLVGKGMRNAFAWWEHFNHKCSMELCAVANRFDLACRELAAASRCDVFVGISRMGKGSHVELGAALMGGCPKSVILVGVDPADSVFYDPVLVTVVPTIADALVRIGEILATEWS